MASEVEAICENSGTSILSMHIKTPLGPYSVKVCGGGAHAINRVKGSGIFPADYSIDVLKNTPVNGSTSEGKQVKGGKGKKDSKENMKRMVEWFHLFFSDLSAQDKKFTKPFKFCVPGATEFQTTVWEALQSKVPFGSTITYGELAELAGRPNAARAVGSAMRNNPNCLVVPCHRVLPANSKIGNYSDSGPEIKQWLLEHEKSMAEKAKNYKNGNGAAA